MKRKESFVGLMDYGTAIPESETSEATGAGHWKRPIAFVLQDICSASVQSHPIKNALIYSL